MARKEKQEKEESKEASLEQLQLAEQGMQALLLQKQAFQLELVETESALEELRRGKQEDVFKIVGSLMFKSNKAELEQELSKKHDILELRLKAIEKHEAELKTKLLKAREELVKKLKGTI